MFPKISTITAVYVLFCDFRRTALTQVSDAQADVVATEADPPLT